MWRLNAAPRTILPVPVFLNRLAAPRCVLSFGISLFLAAGLRGDLLSSLRRALSTGPAVEDHVHLVAFLPRHRLRDRLVAEVRNQPLENAPADLRVRHLAFAEEDRRLHLVAVGEEALDVLLLEVVVVLVHLRAELDFLHLDHALMLLGLAGPLLLLVLVFAEIHDSAHRRHGSRRDLDQVEPLLTRDGHCLLWRHDPELLSGLVNHANFTDADALVGADAVVTSGRTIESYSCLLCGQNQTLFRLKAEATAQPVVASAFRRKLHELRRSLAVYFLTRVGEEGVHGARTKVTTGPAADRHRSLRRLPVSSHQHVGDLLQLRLSDLIANLLLPVVELHPQPGRRQLVPDAPGVVVMTV